ncbi:MAG: N,N'-diacetylbacillosaminyl-diphospho-undecaprenol alpha-1,3-N-acetylgalactosaminyltransferase [Alphaproteobacteria bacterium MarineAlpha5_Bin11]|nr:glycosyltransferase family 1 protein [Pelagibacteraceae bacterium]PPR44703.1 MAG: N,N'-diacetylbacillosaminyl-diphospho-undecaprenol alpha-1,3-N-acetylgalactosaminyltransferase [Alphaproteobacteria bacterium MarineAlpha5_Bin11]
MGSLSNLPFLTICCLKNYISMKIIISANSSWNIYNFRFGLVSSLIKNNHEVIVLSTIDDYSKKLEEIGCKIIKISLNPNKKSPFDDSLLLINYIYLFYKLKPDIFLGFTIKPNIYGSIAANITNIKVINNISGLGTAFIENNFLQTFIKFLYKLSLRKSFRVFFQNSDDLKLFKRNNLIYSDKSYVIPGSGINLNIYKYSPIKEHKTNTNFLFLGRFLWDKGIYELIKAIRIVKKNNNNVKFNFLGFIEKDNPRGIPENQINEWINEGLINYLGKTDDVRQHIIDSDCVLLPSYREGMPRSLIEAAAIGRPLIASNVAGCKDLIKEDLNGYLCKVKNYQDLCNKLNNFISLPFKERLFMGKESRKIIENKFNEELIIDIYNKAIKSAFER